jgi:ribosomal protein L37AE/L43A
MKMNRIQFQPGLSMPEFAERYGTEAQCQAALQAARWPDGFACPKCGGAARSRFERERLRYWQCGHCAYQRSVLSGTLFEATKLPLSRWFMAMQLLTQCKNNGSALELRRQLGVSYRTAWLMKHRIMEAMRLREGRARSDRHRRRQGEREAAAVLGRQRAARQPEERHYGHLPCLRLRQVRPPLPRQVPVPLQPQVQHAHHPVLTARRLGNRTAHPGAPPAAC